MVDGPRFPPLWDTGSINDRGLRPTGASERSLAHNSDVELGNHPFRSQETILLDDDGHSFRMTGSQTFFPRLWKATTWSAHGAVAADHDIAVYHIPFFGVTLEQRTRVTSQGLEVIQTTPFSWASILLRWQRPLRTEPDPAADGGGM